jgi:hypothetical protein
VEADWPQKILRQAIHVSCFAAEIRGLGYELLFGVSEAAGAGSGQFFQLILIRVSKNAKLDADFESVEKVIKKFPQKSY